MKASKLSAAWSFTLAAAAQIDWKFVFSIVTAGLLLLAKATYLAGVFSRHAAVATWRYVQAVLDQSQQQLNRQGTPTLWSWLDPLVITFTTAIKPLTDLTADGWRYGLLTFDLINPPYASSPLPSWEVVAPVFIAQPCAPQPQSLNADFASLSVRDLRAMASELGLKGVRKCRKELLIQRLAAALHQ